MYEQPELYFDSLSKKYNIDYVLGGDSERANYDVDSDYFATRYPVFYQNGSVVIYDVRGAS